MVGEGTGSLNIELKQLGWGRMWIARKRNIYTYVNPPEPWGFDNGAYRDWQSGEQFSESEYLQSLDKAQAHHTKPYLAVLPDIPAGGQDSLDLSLEWLDRVPAEFPWYIAVQDGLEPHHIEPYVDRIAGCFLGGTDEYKATAGDWAAWCRAPHVGLRFHYGRCGTLAKVAHAHEIGADSIDSAYPQMYPAMWRVFREAVLHAPQGDFFWTGRVRA